MSIGNSKRSWLNAFVIVFAAAALSACASSPPIKTTGAPGSFFRAPVFAGDTASVVAARYQVKIDDLMALNGIKDPNRRVYGWVRVPTSSTARDVAPQPAPPPQQQAQGAPPPQQQAQPVAPPQALTVPRPERAQIEKRTLDAPMTNSQRPGVAQNISLPPPRPIQPAPEAAPPAAPASDNSWLPDWLLQPQAPPAAVEPPHKLLWPVKGSVISPFGESPNGRNDGINISAQRGTPIFAADAGTVSYVGNELKGYGNLILIKHDNGFVTAYAHADTIHVQRGEHVERGQVIASTGNTGDVDQPQLHFELRIGTRPVDPTPYLADVMAAN